MKLGDIQGKTLQEMGACLEKNKMCLVDRPTGFGKTKVFMEYAKRHQGQRILYVYDMDSAKVDIQQRYSPKNVGFISYGSIARKSKFEDVKKFMLSNPWHTIIFDEAHLMGGENIKAALKEILPQAVKDGTRVLGGTATRVRTDGVDVAKEFFDGHLVSEYNMLNAIEDGIMLSPIWVMTCRYQEMLKSLEQEATNGEARAKFVGQSLQQLTRAYSKLDGVGSVYRSTVEATYGEIPDIMRFIIFYPTVQSLKDNMQKDIREFGQAFPQHTVNYVAITSDDEHYSTASEAEVKFEFGGKQVQLMFAVNILNQAYHSEFLTGVVMRRASFSNIIFTQQLGRVMSVAAKKPGIVFDNVGNALISPERAIVAVKQQLADQAKSDGENVRTYDKVRLQASREFIQFINVYERIKATMGVTPEQEDYAKYLVNELGAPIELVMQGLNLSKADAEGLVHGA